MSVNRFIMKDASKARNDIEKEQRLEILKLYEDVGDRELRSIKARLDGLDTLSARIRMAQVEEWYQGVLGARGELAKEIAGTIERNIYMVSSSVVTSSNKWLAELGFIESGLDENISMVRIPQSIVEKLVSGQIYEFVDIAGKTGDSDGKTKNWNLAKAIWGSEEKNSQKAYNIVAGGIFANKGIYEIANDLESFVLPNARKKWNLKDKDGRPIYPSKVDYSSQRLARTLMQHGYQQSIVETTKENPFIQKYVWRANGSRACDICLEMDGQKFDKDKLPLDHPNGMCVIDLDVADNLEEQIANWIKSADGTYPEIDEFAKQFGYTPQEASRDPESTQKALDKLIGETTSEAVESALERTIEGVARYTEEDIRSTIDNKIIGRKRGYTDEVRQEFFENINYMQEEVRNAVIDTLHRENLETKHTSTREGAHLNSKGKFAGIEDGVPKYDFSFEVRFPQVKDRVSYSYTSSKESLNSVFFHELGHAIDTADITRVKDVAEYKQRIISAGDEFINAMLEDLANIAEDFKSDGFLKYALLDSIEQRKMELSGVQDVLGGFSSVFGGDIAESLKAEAIGLDSYDFGHSTSYWTRGDTMKELSSELFAHITSSHASISESEVAHYYFPKYNEVYLKVLKERFG